MPHKNKRARSPLHVIQRDFHDAIDRLVSGAPRDAGLKRLAAEDRLQINPTTVAKEARRSRTLIAIENCRLPDVRNRILELSRSSDIALPRTANEVIVKLRADVAELERQKECLFQENRDLFLACEEAERNVKRLRAEQLRQHENEIEDAKVTPITGRPKEKPNKSTL
jgi:hypothetical protein